MPSADEIRESIDARIAELQAEAASLEAARAELRGARPPRDRALRARVRRAVAAETQSETGPSSETPVPPGVAAPPQPRMRGTRRNGTAATARKRPEVLLAGKLTAMLGESSDGLAVGAIASSANARDTQVRALLRELEGAGEIRRTGVGRGTRWRLVTDEERIAERAAELAKLSRRQN